MKRLKGILSALLACILLMAFSVQVSAGQEEGPQIMPRYLWSTPRRKLRAERTNEKDKRKGKYDGNNEFWLFIATSATNGVVTQAAMLANAGDAAWQSSVGVL